MPFSNINAESNDNSSWTCNTMVSPIDWKQSQILLWDDGELKPTSIPLYKNERSAIYSSSLRGLSYVVSRDVEKHRLLLGIHWPIKFFHVSIPISLFSHSFPGIGPASLCLPIFMTHSCAVYLPWILFTIHPTTRHETGVSKIESKMSF